MSELHFPDMDLKAIDCLAGQLAAIVKGGDHLTLRGDLGAGKSTFARSFIQHFFNDLQLEVPSPTFSLMHSYAPLGQEGRRAILHHYDFYRLSDVSEIEELGFFDDMDHRISLIEWPERLGAELPAHYLDLEFTDADHPDRRNLSLMGYGHWQQKLNRFQTMRDFVESEGWGMAKWSFCQGDASARSYYYLTRTNDGGEETVLLMNAPNQPDGPVIRDGKPYSQIAHLAENMKSFTAVAAALKARGIHAPEIYAHNLTDGLLLLEDLGSAQYGKLIAEGEDQFELTKAAIDILLRLRLQPPGGSLPVGDGRNYRMPSYDVQALIIEAELLLDWTWPLIKGQEVSEAQREAFRSIWQQLFQHLAAESDDWVLRDFHSPNLIRCPEEDGLSRVAVIDFQDALKGHLAYDLVSLCQDARVDVSAALETDLVDYYIAGARQQNERPFKEDEFRTAYTILGAQRATKLLGIFVRLARRDAKLNYLQHIPRNWDYLERNLKHPHLTDLGNWYRSAFPEGINILQLRSAIEKGDV